MIVRSFPEDLSVFLDPEDRVWTWIKMDHISVHFRSLTVPFLTSMTR